MSNQQTRVLIELREMILRGEIGAGERLAEIPLADRLGASRTPVRLALSQLEQEGLVVPSRSGGFIVRAFTVAEIDDAIAVRGLLEGMAARLIAERGLTRGLARDLRGSLDAGDRILADPALDYNSFQAYVEMNARFHALIIEGSGNHALQRAHLLNEKLPFASANAFVSAQALLPRRHGLLVFAHAQHHHLVEALEAGQGARAQAIGEEHAQNAKQNLRLALALSSDARTNVPGLALIRDGAGGVFVES